MTKTTNPFKDLDPREFFFWIDIEEGNVEEVDEEGFHQHQQDWDGPRPQDFDGGRLEHVDADEARTLYGNGDFTTDDESLVGTGAIKYDGGKPCVYRGLVNYFPRAAMSVAGISTFGANKYAWNGWEGVEDGIARYSDAMMRHFMQEAAGEEFDQDSGLMHAAHAAWGAMARLELILREKERERDG